MRLVIALGAALLACATAQDSCQNFRKDEFRQALVCAKNGITGKYQKLEDEYEAELDAQMEQCFIHSTSKAEDLDGTGDEKCVLQRRAFGRDMASNRGPLRRCRLCVVIAKRIRNAFLKTSEREMKCVRRRIRDAIRKEVEPCIQGKLPEEFAENFRVPKLPDFDEGSKDVREQLIRVTSKHMVIAGRMQLCERMPERLQNTQDCIERIDDNKSYRPSICEILQYCDGRVSRKCKSSGEYKQVTDASCACVHDKSKMVKDIMRNVRTKLSAVFEGSAPRDRFCPGNRDSCKCAMTIRRALRTEYNDWLAVANSAFTGCIRPKPKLDLETLLEKGCAFAVKQSNHGKYMEIIFKFLELFVDAITDRVQRFCNDCGL